VSEKTKKMLHLKKKTYLSASTRTISVARRYEGLVGGTSGSALLLDDNDDDDICYFGVSFFFFFSLRWGRLVQLTRRFWFALCICPRDLSQVVHVPFFCLPAGNVK